MGGYELGNAHGLILCEFTCEGELGAGRNVHGFVQVECLGIHHTG